MVWYHLYQVVRGRIANIVQSLGLAELLRSLGMNFDLEYQKLLWVPILTEIY